MVKSAKSPAVDAYLARFSGPVVTQLQALRKHVLSLGTDLEETMAYGIPTYRWRGKNVFHFGAFARHMGLYPGSRAIEVHAQELTGFKTSKGAIQVPLAEPLPLELVTRLVRFNQQQLE